jgi:hypothetical protein
MMRTVKLIVRLAFAVLCIYVAAGASADEDKVIDCSPDEVRNAGATLWVRSATIDIDESGKAEMIFSAGSIGACAPQGADASILMFRLLKNGKPITPFANAEPAFVAGNTIPTPHTVDVTDKFKPAYWKRADSCEITMPGQAYCN